MRVIFTDGHKEFMCMQSSKRAATHSQDQSDRLLHVILTLFLLQKSLLLDWSDSHYEVIWLHVMLRHEF